MVLRTPLLLVAVVATAIVALALPGDGSGLLILTPALAMVLPLLFSAYVGERSLARLTSLLVRLRLSEAGRSAASSLVTAVARPSASWFSDANGSRGPPLLSA
jgi:hypothetical protein